MHLSSYGESRAVWTSLVFKATNECADNYYSFRAKLSASSEIKRQIRRSKQTRIKLAWEFKVLRSLALKKHLRVRVVLYSTTYLKI